MCLPSRPTFEELGRPPCLGVIGAGDSRVGVGGVGGGAALRSCSMAMCNSMAPGPGRRREATDWRGTRGAGCGRRSERRCERGGLHTHTHTHMHSTLKQFTQILGQVQFIIHTCTHMHTNGEIEKNIHETLQQSAYKIKLNKWTRNKKI